MTEKTIHADIAAGDQPTDRLWKRTDAKISASSHLCEWRLSIEIKWH